MKTLKDAPFRGVNNRLPDTALVTEEGVWLRDALNVDIDKAGGLKRRAGYALIQAMTAPHSLFERGSIRLMVRNAILYQITPEPYSEAPIMALASNAPMSYVVANGSIYFSNGTDSGRYDGAAVYPWGMATPAQPSLTVGAGTLDAGKYRVAVTFYNITTGEESGHAGAASIEASGGIVVSLPAATDGATHVRVYASTADGDVLFQQGGYVVGTPSVTLSTIATNTERLQRHPEAPLPASADLFVHMGRLCGRSGNMLYYGEPYRFGYYRPSKGFVWFESDIALAVPNQNGVYVATENLTQWIPGDLEKPDGPLVDVLPYGAVPGTAFAFPTRKRVGWFSPKGVVVGDPAGQVETPMQDNIDLTPPATGVTRVVEGEGYRRIVSCGWAMSLDTGAATRYDNYSFTSYAGQYATGAGGLYRLSGNQDAGAPIDASADLGKRDFGAENKKAIPAIYLNCSSEREMQVTVTDDEGESYTYEANSYSKDNLKVHRVDPGLGFDSGYFDVSISNKLGADFYMASVSFMPVMSSRRV